MVGRSLALIVAVAVFQAPSVVALLTAPLARSPSSRFHRYTATFAPRQRLTVARGSDDDKNIIDADYSAVAGAAGDAKGEEGKEEKGGGASASTEAVEVDVVDSISTSSSGGGSTSSSSGVSSYSDSTSSTKAPEKEGFLAFLKGPEKEPEPPMPTDPVLKAIAQDFGLRKGIASNWIFLSLILDHKAKAGGPALVAAAKSVRFWLWTMFGLSAVWEELNKAAKRDDLQRPPNKLINFSLLLAGVHLLVASAASVPLLVSSSVAPVPKLGGGRVPLGILIACLIPSFNVARRFGVLGGVRAWFSGEGAGQATGGIIRRGGSVLSVAYGVLATEAVVTAMGKPPATLPFLRAAVLYVLHVMAADNNRREIGSERFRKLNDAIFYISFSMFTGKPEPGGSLLLYAVSNAVPIAYLIASTQAKQLSTTTAKELQEGVSAS